MERIDLVDVGLLFKKVFNSEGEEWSYENARKHVDQNFLGDAHWVAQDADIIVGFLIGIVLTREKGDELFIDSICIEQTYQNQGIGKRLWETAVEYVRKKGLKGIRLLANPNLKSYKWYKEMGYKESEWVELFKQDV